MANSVDPDETAHYEPSHLDLHCLHRYLFWSAGLKGFSEHTFAEAGAVTVALGSGTDSVVGYLVSRSTLQILLTA